MRSILSQKNLFKVYPNPARDVIFVENEFNDALITYELYHINGAIFHQGKSRSKSLSIELPETTPSGLYVLAMKNKFTTETHLIIIE